MNEYTINDLFDSSSPNYIGALRFSTPPPSAQMSGLGGVSPATLAAGEIQGNTTVSDGFLKSENYVAATSGWQLTPTSGEINFSLSVQQIVLGTSGYVRGGQTDYNTGTGFFFGYSGAAYKFSVGNPSGQYLTWDGTTLTIGGVSQVIKNFTAGETLVAGNPVYIATAGAGTDTSISQLTTAANDSIFAGNWKAQTFTTDANVYQISTVSLSLNKTGSPSGNVVVSLYAASGGSPTGSALATATMTANSLTTSFVTYDFTLNGNVIPSAVYAIVISCPSGNVGDQIQAQRTTTNVYAGGAALTSSNSGSTWADIGTCDYYFTINEKRTLSGSVYKTSALVAGTSDAFIGFIYSNCAAAATAPVVIAGSATGLSGLTLASKYYLSDTFGSVSSSAGTVSKKVGIAVSTTELLITNLW